MQDRALCGVWRGALDCCAKKAHHPLWTVLVDSSAPQLGYISRTGEKSRSQSQNLRPTHAVKASDPTQTRVRHSSLFFFNRLIQIERVTSRVPEHVQDSGRDNPRYESLLVVEVGYQRRPIQSLIHNILWRRTQLLAMILLIILYRY